MLMAGDIGNSRSAGRVTMPFDQPIVIPMPAPIPVNSPPIETLRPRTEWPANSFLAQTRTAAHVTDETFVWRSGDWDRDGHLDLFGIKMAATGTPTTEVHILSEATNFQTFLLNIGTALPVPKDVANWDYAISDWNRDGWQDLIGIKNATRARKPRKSTLSRPRLCFIFFPCQ